MRPCSTSSLVRAYRVILSRSWQPDRRLQDIPGTMTSHHTVTLYLQGLALC